MSNSPPKPIRNTFGIYDPSTKKRYTDILGSHLQLRRLLLEEWLEIGSIAESKDRQKDYKILLDYQTQRALAEHKLIDVIVSFQHRKDGCYAVCRLWDASRSNTRQQILNTDKEYQNA